MGGELVKLDWERFCPRLIVRDPGLHNARRSHVTA